MEQKQSTDQWIQATQQRWATEDTTAAIKNLAQQQQPQPLPKEVSLNPSLIYLDDRALWNLDSPPPQSNWVPVTLACILLVVILLIIWKIHSK